MIGLCGLLGIFWLSTIPPTSRAPEPDAPSRANDAIGGPAGEADAAPVTVPAPPARRRSLAARMMAIAAVWIGVLLVGGGFALDRTLTCEAHLPAAGLNDSEPHTGGV